MIIERRGLGQGMSFEDFMEMYGLTLVITGKQGRVEATIEYNDLQFYKAKMDGQVTESLVGDGPTEKWAIQDLVRQLDCNCIAIVRYKIVVPHLRL